MYVSLIVAVLAQVGPPAGSPRRTPVVEVVEKAGPAVVNIATELASGDNPFGQGIRGAELFNQFYGQRRREPQQSLGSGVIIDNAQGLVLTNEHVVSHASVITVTLADRRTFEAELVGADPAFDLALLKIRNGKQLPVVSLGKSGDLVPGEPVVAIGNPFGLSNSVTTGVVSALHRSIELEDRIYEDFIQTDAAINPGNSGGALLDIEGNLIGINTAIHGQGSGIGFAIPIDRALAIVDEVVRYGEVRPAFVGVQIDYRSTGGARVMAVLKDSPAQEAGLLPGDRIVDLGGQEVRSGRSYRNLERGLIPGRKVRFTVFRGEDRLQLELPIRELSFERATALGQARLGIRVKPGQGALQIEALSKGSHAARIGIRSGDYLLGMGGRRLDDLATFERLVAALHSAEAVTVVIGRNGRAYSVTLDLTAR